MEVRVGSKVVEPTNSLKGAEAMVASAKKTV